MKGKEGLIWDQVRRMLNSGKWEIKFQLNPHISGEVDPVECIIYLDPRDDMLPVLLHECLHIVLHQADEDIVDGWRYNLMNKMRAKEWRTLFRLFLKNYRG